MNDEELAGWSSVADINIETSQLRIRVESIRSELLHDAARAFLANINNLDSLLNLPGVLSYTAAIHSLSNWKAYNTALNALYADERPSLPEFQDQIRTAINSVLDRDNQAEIAKEQCKILDFFFESDNMRAALKTLLLSAIVSAWTAFECLSTDVWVATVNAYPQTLAMRALSAPANGNSVDGLGGKQVQVSFLAKHGFDLRFKMGGLLKPKFDLTSLENFRAAYLPVFGKSDELKAIFASQDLNLLEASRHVIVHRAGIMDEQFCSRVRAMNLVVAPGAPLCVEGRLASRLSNSAIEAGCALLGHIDRLLARDQGQM
jgi:hypothetical protein